MSAEPDFTQYSSSSKFMLAEKRLLVDHQLELGIDYAYTFKHGYAHVICAEAFKDTVREVFMKYAITVSSLTTY